MPASVRTIYNGRDPRYLPTYSLRESAHYLQIPVATLRSWVCGRFYPVRSGRSFFKPVVELPEPAALQLSFINLIEAHVLDSIRREYEIPLNRVRKAVCFLKRTLEADHPLADQRILTDHHNLFVQQFEALVNVSQGGQLAIRSLLEAHLRRIEWGDKGIAFRLYPFTRKRELNEPKVVVIDPYVSFGRPVLAHSGIPTAVIAERFKAGDSVEQLADDYGRAPRDIQEAIRCELALEAA